MKLLIGILLVVTLHSLAQAKPAVQLSINPEQISAKADKFYYYNFGHVPVNFRERADIYLRNTGDENLEVKGIYILGSAYWAWSNCPNRLGPNQVCRTTVEFRPWHDGYFAGRLRFAFPVDNIYVDLYGWGRRR
ncbi:hypothetical protein ACES2L_09655 [Bdellovibrio bacteriovorus]